MQVSDHRSSGGKAETLLVHVPQPATAGEGIVFDTQDMAAGAALSPEWPSVILLLVIVGLQASVCLKQKTWVSCRCAPVPRIAAVIVF